MRLERSITRAALKSHSRGVLRMKGKHILTLCMREGVAKSASRTVIPKSKTESRIQANLEGDFKLEPEDVKKIDSIDKKLRFNDPSGELASSVTMLGVCANDHPSSRIGNFGWDFYKDLDGKVAN